MAASAAANALPPNPVPFRRRFFETLLSNFEARLDRQVDVATEKTDTYQQKLEAAAGPDVFKFFLLINVASIEKYVAQTRIQAQISFKLCRQIALLSFALIATGVILAIYSTIWGNHTFDASKLAALSGVITQFIASVFFYLHNRTLQQFNLFGDKVSSAQRVAISLLANAAITDNTRRDSSTADLIKALLEQPAPAIPQTQPV